MKAMKEQIAVDLLGAAERMGEIAGRMKRFWPLYARELRNASAMIRKSWVPGIRKEIKKEDGDNHVC